MEIFPAACAERPAAIAGEMYLDLLKKCLTRSAFPGLGRVQPARGTIRRKLFDAISRVLASRRMAIAKLPPEDAGGAPDPQTAGETMMGLPRLNNLQECIADVIRRNVPGDFAEAGVWRGGGVIFMRAMLKALGETDRVVWVADSFQGVPAPDALRYPSDAGDTHWTQDYLAVSLPEVKANFERYGLLDDQVRFLPGWFSATLPDAPIDRLAILRLDGDIYESTTDALSALYPKLSPGGWVIVDDYGGVASCGAAVDDYRSQHGIATPMRTVDDPQQSCVYWRKEH
jgi:O-methyltransferase